MQKKEHLCPACGRQYRSENLLAQHTNKFHPPQVVGVKNAAESVEVN